MSFSTHLGRLKKSHRPSKECLEVNDWLGTFSAATFEHHSESEHGWLDCLRQSGLAVLTFEEFAAQGLENDVGRNTLS